MHACAAIRLTLSPCGNDHTAEVVRGQTNNTFTCMTSSLGRAQQVDWRLFYQSYDYGAGSCPAVSTGNPCSQGELGAAFTPSRPSSTQSVMTLDPTLVNNDVILRSGTLQCADIDNAVRCQLDYIGEYECSVTSVMCSVSLDRTYVETEQNHAVSRDM